MCQKSKLLVVISVGSYLTTVQIFVLVTQLDKITYKMPLVT